MKKSKNKNGFTLIEIVVVLIIVAILAAVGVPNVFNNVVKSQASAAMATSVELKTPIEQCFGTHPGDDPTTTTNCTISALNLPQPGNGWTIDLVGVAGSSSSAGDLAYDLVAQDKSNVIGSTLVRFGNGSFRCVAGVGNYDDVC